MQREFLYHGRGTKEIEKDNYNHIKKKENFTLCEILFLSLLSNLNQELIINRLGILFVHRSNENVLLHHFYALYMPHLVAV